MARSMALRAKMRYSNNPSRTPSPTGGSKAPLGSGGRFAALKSKLSKEKGVTNPGGLAAYLGRRSLGKAKFQALAAAGKKGGG